MESACLTGRIDPAAWPEIDASCHQSLLILRSTARLWKELGRHLQLGVRNCRNGFARSCLPSILETVLAAMASPLPGSNATGSPCLFQAVSSGHQYLRPRLLRFLRRAIAGYRRPRRLPRRPRLLCTIPFSICSAMLFSFR